MPGSRGEVSWLLSGRLRRPAQDGYTDLVSASAKDLLTKNTGLCFPSSLQFFFYTKYKLELVSSKHL